MSGRHWFLPDVPDVLGLLRHQVALTVEGVDAFAAWAAGGGDARAAARVRALEHEADAAKRELRSSLRSAFVTPLDPEDLFALSRGIDSILNHAKDAIGESEVMRCPPDGATATMAALLAESVHDIDAGVARIAEGSADAEERADAAVKAERRVEKAYRAAMGALAELDDLRAVMGRQELYRRCSQIGEATVDVAERLIYADLKES
ncbi:MAG: DUF47 domain-containing protein [Solirubrobacteraceae bacterium]